MREFMRVVYIYTHIYKYKNIFRHGNQKIVYYLNYFFLNFIMQRNFRFNLERSNQKCVNLFSFVIIF